MTTFKEYSRMRDIVRKRNIRLAEQGLAPLVHFPTVKEIKAGIADKGAAFRAVSGYYSEGSTVTAVKQTGLVPDVISFPEMPQARKLSSASQKQRKRDWNRAYRQRKAIRNAADSPEEARKHIHYLEALRTMSVEWKKAGIDIGLNINKLTPAQARDFVEYMDYRFSQGDYTQHYVIDEFIQDFSKALSKGHSAKDIIYDFNVFMLHRAEVEKRQDNMIGLSSSEWDKYWRMFSGRKV